jgi:hypothetical protein
MHGELSLVAFDHLTGGRSGTRGERRPTRRTAAEGPLTHHPRLTAPGRTRPAFLARERGAGPRASGAAGERSPDARLRQPLHLR